MASFNLDSLTINPRTLSEGEFGVLFRNGNIAAASSVAMTVYGAAVVRNGGAISSITDAAISAIGPGFLLENTGDISGGKTAIQITAADDDTEARIVSSGTIYATAEGYAAIQIAGYGATIVNTGEIVALGGDAITFTDNSWSGHENNLFNGGHIYASSGSNFAILGSGAADMIENAGTVSGNIDTGRGVDVLTNAGMLTGDVNLGPGNDKFEGRTGKALGVVSGGMGDDTLRAGSEGEELAGGQGNDLIRGGRGDDTLVGGTESDTVQGGAGDDVLEGSEGNDTVAGAGGDDLLDGGKSADLVRGGSGDDTLLGSGGKDDLRGGQGEDSVVGGEGDDILKGGRGADSLEGGLGADTFVYSPGHGADHILDFTHGEDQLNLVAFGLRGLTQLETSFVVIESNQGVRIDFGLGDIIVLDGVTRAILDDEDFLF